jgi:hypothetical protein
MAKKMKAAQSQFSTKMEIVESDEEFAEIYERMDTKKASESSYNRAIEEINIQLYDPTLIDDIGRFDYDERDNRIVNLEKKYGKAVITSALAQARANEHPLQKLWREDVEVVKHFWVVADSVSSTIYDNTAVTQKDKDLLRAYLDSKTTQKQRKYFELLAGQEVKDDPERAYSVTALGGEKIKDKDVISLFQGLVKSERDWMRSAEGYGSMTPPGDLPSARRINEAIIRWDWRPFAPTIERPGQLPTFLQGIR